MVTAIAQNTAADKSLNLKGVRAEAEPRADYVTLIVPFQQVRHLLERFPAQRRPNRNRPIQDAELDAELSAWEAATDEVWNDLD